MNKDSEKVKYLEEDTIDLRELWKALMKRKMLISLITVSITTLAIAYTLLTRPIYEVKSNIQIGYLGYTINADTGVKTKKLVSSADSLVKVINIVFNVEDKLHSKEEFVSEVSNVSANKNLLDFITINTLGISNEDALQKNKEVVEYIQKLYQLEIDQYLINTKNSIANAKRAIVNIDDFLIKNLKEQIRLLKTQKIVKIDEKIQKLKTQDIVKLEKKINQLKTQKIVSIDEKIEFLEKKKLKAIEAKLDFYKKKLNEYIEAIDKLIDNKDSSSEAKLIVSMQMVNYQNLVLNAQNRIEDLKIEKETLLNVTIVALQREKKNIEEVSIKDLEIEIKNINNLMIVNLRREKENISNEQIRKLQHQIDVDLVNKKIGLNQKINTLQYNMSEQNVQNSKVIGRYVIIDYPVKPKKKLIIIVAFATGLILSIFLAFFLEFIQAGRKNEE